MNIWIINHYAVPPEMPGETRAFGFAKALTEQGHDVTLISSAFRHADLKYCEAAQRDPGKTAWLETCDGIRFLWLSASCYGGYLKRMWNMAEFAIRARFDRSLRELPRPDIIVGSTLTLFAALAACRLARKLHVPFIFEVRDVWPQTLIDFGMSRWNPGVILLGIIERYLCRKADTIVTLLPASIDHLRACGAVCEIAWLPNGVHFGLVPQPQKPCGYAPFKVVFAGSHSQANSPETLVHAAAVLQNRGRRDVHILFFGDGPLKAHLRKLATDNQLTNVEFNNWVPKTEIFDVYSRADATVALLQDVELYRFGMSLNKLHDYMAAGRPVIFAARSFNDPVSESNCGIVVPPENPVALADAIEKLVGMSLEERWKMGLRGREYAERHHDFLWLAEKLEDVLRRARQRFDESASGKPARTAASRVR
ncbi:MAG TPA: glycosyltransferase family 4 protein [Terracidiphilus sp.]|jgi:glycosyltransferase involved in cell wall biosynthesis